MALTPMHQMPMQCLVSCVWVAALGSRGCTEARLVLKPMHLLAMIEHERQRQQVTQRANE